MAAQIKQLPMKSHSTFFSSQPRLDPNRSPSKVKIKLVHVEPTPITENGYFLEMNFLVGSFATLATRFVCSDFSYSSSVIVKSINSFLVGTKTDFLCVRLCFAVDFAL